MNMPTVQVEDERAIHKLAQWQEIDVVSLNARLSVEDWVVVEFWSPDCLFSRLMLPLRVDLSKRFAGRLGLYRCQAWLGNDELYKQWRVSALPAVVLFHRKRALYRWIGETPSCLVLSKIEALFLARPE